MNEENLNRTVRQFLKVVGVTSQREFENAVRQAVNSGRLRGDETLKAKAVMTLAGVDLRFEIDGEIKLA
ncbi:MAG TPA: DUF6494 family protein [Xanthobacteraceae bacterium]|nr:DUF6494 family protein [Xanthobacteraceae bacterium]